MDAKLREQALQQIKEDDECTVIVISIKAGGTGKPYLVMRAEIPDPNMWLFEGLNITACNSVILMDPWWNPFFEVHLLYPLSRNAHISYRELVYNRNKRSLGCTALGRRNLSTCTISSWKIASKSISWR